MYSPSILDLSYDGTYIGRKKDVTYWRYLNKFYKISINGTVLECPDSEIEQLFTGVSQ